jgi:uncharacterized membrane protein YraQ (UPF0718 family)
LIGVLAAALFRFLPANSFVELSSKLNLFATVFLGIFIEALPYLLIGTLISGMVEVFVDRDQITGFVSNRSVPAAVTGALIGLVFPVCECGVIPLARRLFHKGLPLAAGVAFLLAAPVLNPIVIFSTAAAFGWGSMLLWRIGVTLLIAVVIGLVFSVERNSSKEALWLMNPARRDGQVIASQPDYVYGTPSWDPWGKALVFHQFKLRGPYEPEIGLWRPGMKAPQVLARGLMPHWLP